MTVSVVVADANILYSRTLHDYVLYAADAGAIEVNRSQSILDEMSRNLRGNLGLTTADTTRLERLMNDYIEYALVDVGPHDLATMNEVEMNADDRHAVAAALSTQAEIVLTQNTKHFPRARMEGRKIELLTAGELLTLLAATHPDQLRAAHESTVHHSPKSGAEVLATLESIVGKVSADAVRTVVLAGEQHDHDVDDGDGSV